MPEHPSISVYTVLVILRTIRARLGLEAMAEFLDSYTASVERMNPHLKEEVSRALCERALENLYETVMKYEKD